MKRKNRDARVFHVTFLQFPAEDGKYNNSTIFVDLVGPLEGANYTDFNSTAADAAADSQAAKVTKAVKAGYLVRASAYWNVSPPPLPSASLPVCKPLLGLSHCSQ